MSLSNFSELQPFIVSDVRVTGVVLGEGSYGSVEEAEIPGATCVVKKLHEALLPPPTEAHGADRMAATFVAECRLMSTVRHPHIVQFLGVCLLPGSRLPALVMEKLLIDLHNLLENNSAIPLSMKHSILLGVSKGLTYLHTRSPAIIHRDLSARNVLLNSAMVAKIADLGNSRIINVRPSQLMTMTKNPGNMWYMPPEAQEDASKYNTSIDVFSFGNLTLFTLTQQFPKVLAASHTDPNTGRVSARLEVERRSESFEQVYHELGREHPLVCLAEQCLHNLPSRRPPIAEVLERLDAVGEIVRDQYSLLNKLEMVKLHEREMELLHSRMATQLCENDEKVQHDSDAQKELIQLHKRAVAQLGKELQHSNVELQSMQQTHLNQEDELRQMKLQLQSMQQDNEAQLRQKEDGLKLMDEAHRVEIGRQQWRHQEEQEQQQQQLASLEAQLRHLQAQVSPLVI